MTDDIVDEIFKQTCLYADQYMSTHTIPPCSRINRWKKVPFTIEELRRFFALVVLMGMMDYPQIENYWVTGWPFATSTFSSVMSRDRFSLILRFLHRNDNSGYKQKGEDGYDALYKIRPFLTKLLQRFEAMYTPEKELSLDEGMIRSKGRLSFIQYMPKKPTKWGLKAFVLADSKSGYTFRWRLYTGKTRVNQNNTHSIMHETIVHTYR